MGTRIGVVLLTLLFASPAFAQTKTMPPLGEDAPQPLKLAAVTDSYNRGIVIDGNESYRKAVRATLDSLARTPTGHALLAQLDAAGRKGHTVTIKPNSDGQESEEPASMDDASPLETRTRADGGLEVLKPGKGSDSTVSYDPDFKADIPKALARDRVELAQALKDGKIDQAKFDKLSKQLDLTGPATCLTGEVVLGHELTHALHSMTGRNLRLKTFVEKNGTETDQEEEATSGLGPYARDAITENAIRHDLEVEQRTTYATLCTPQRAANPWPKAPPPRHEEDDQGFVQKLDPIAGASR